MTRNVTWRIGSVTKMFTATTVMQLVDDGMLLLDAPASEYMDHGFVPETVTVRDLLQHTSGISDYLVVVNDVLRSCPDRIDPWTMIDADPEFVPGSEWAYSNTNYLILGNLIEAVTGTEPAAVIRSRIIEPLDLESTYLEGSEPGPPPVPAVADFYETGPGPIVCDTPMWPDATDGGMISSVDDLDTFMRALFEGELVSKASLAEMTAVNEFGYGLGVSQFLDPRVADVSLFGHGGGVVGYKTEALYEANTGTTIITMSPTGFGTADQTIQAIEWEFKDQPRP